MTKTKAGKIDNSIYKTLNTMKTSNWISILQYGIHAMQVAGFSSNSFTGGWFVRINNTQSQL